MNLNNAEENCLYNIAGYFAWNLHIQQSLWHMFYFCCIERKRRCCFCKISIVKRIQSGMPFLCEKKFFFSLFRPMEIIFWCLERYLMDCNNCHEYVLEKFITDENLKTVKIPDCHYIKYKIIKRFVSFHLKKFGAKRTREINWLIKLKRSGEFSSKSSMRVLAE